MFRKCSCVDVSAQLVTAFSSNTSNARHMLHVYTRPHKARLRGGGLRLLCAVLGSRCNPASNTSLRFISQCGLSSCDFGTHQVQCSSDQMVFHTRTILRTPSSYHDDRMLLHIVTCALVS